MNSDNVQKIASTESDDDVLINDQEWETIMNNTVQLIEADQSSAADTTLTQWKEIAETSALIANQNTVIQSDASLSGWWKND